MIQSAREAALVVFCLLGIGVLPALGQDPAKSKVRKVTASASATAHIKPDSARITFAVTTDETNANTARNEHANTNKSLQKDQEAPMSALHEVTA